MMLTVETELFIKKPPAEVFEGWADPEKMAKYFITSSTGRMEAGKTLTWRWADYGDASASVQVLEAEPGKRLKFIWGGGGVESTVQALFEAKDGGTRVVVSEGEWEGDEAGIKRYGGQMQGWVNMLLCLKAFLLFGIDLRRS